MLIVMRESLPVMFCGIFERVPGGVDRPPASSRADGVATLESCLHLNSDAVVDYPLADIIAQCTALTLAIHVSSDSRTRFAVIRNLSLPFHTIQCLQPWLGEALSSQSPGVPRFHHPGPPFEHNPLPAFSE